MEHTSLTPQMERVAFAHHASASSSVPLSEEKSIYSPSLPGLQEGSAAAVRYMVENCLATGITSTACILADRLLRMPDSQLGDVILFARCFHIKGEPRRCLAALEHKGLLAAQVLATLSEVLTPKAQSTAIPGVFYDYLEAVHLAAQCLFLLDQYDDCVNLLDPVVFAHIDGGDDSVVSAAVQRARNVCRSDAVHEVNQVQCVNVMASVYSLVGRCCDLLENKSRAATCLTAAIRIDPACTEAVEYLVDNALISRPEKERLFDFLLDFRGREWLNLYYRFVLLEEVSAATEQDLLGVPGTGSPENSFGGIDVRLSSIVLVRRAERLHEAAYPAEAYRLARQAYIMDPFDNKGLLVYIATMVELQLTTELFYLGHELSKTYPKACTSWYAVGCYYWICRKLEHAQKYLQKAIKLNKRLVHAWVALGHVLAAQEESEHAISAFRTSSRLLPGDHRPLMFMARELVRTNYLSLALHLLFGALRVRPQDPSVLNELGVVYLKQDRLEDALEYLSLAASVMRTSIDDSDCTVAGTGKVLGDEVFSNYATALRRSKRFEEALHWYQVCLAVNPNDANTHAHIGFTLHLLWRCGDAISSYHKALSLQPNFSFCNDMLLRAVSDFSLQTGAVPNSDMNSSLMSDGGNSSTSMQL